MKYSLILVIALIAACSAAVPWSPKKNKTQPRIIGGQLGDICNHPWLVSLREEDSFKCGAVLIKPDKALTAAHCYDGDIAARSYSVYAGSNDRNSYGELANVGRIYVHPDYRIDSMRNDLAVVWLLKSLTVGSCIHPIPMAALNEVLPGGVVAKVAGWGRGGFSEDLYETDLPVLSSKDCASTYGNHINVKNVICAGYVEGGPDVTEGDSGGPLVYKNTLYGIVSWGATSSSGNPKYVGVYTRVAAFRAWIDEAITEEYSPVYNIGY